VYEQSMLVKENRPTCISFSSLPTCFTTKIQSNILVVVWNIFIDGTNLISCGICSVLVVQLQRRPTHGQKHTFALPLVG